MKKKFVIIGSAHGHIYEIINDMLDMGVEFKGIYNDNSILYREISEKYKVPIYNNIDELLDMDVQFAGTAAINCDKIDIIEICCDKGVSIIADKPIVTNEQQYLRLKKVIESGKIEVGMLLTLRFMPQIYAIKNLISDGGIGKLLSVEILNPHSLYVSQRPDWHFSKKQSGGIIVDLMPHSVDLYRWLTESEITEFSGVVKKSILKEKPDFYDISEFFVSSDNGVNGYFRVDWHMTDAHWSWGDLRVFCTGIKGCLEARVCGDPLTKEPLVVYFRQNKETTKLILDQYENSATKDFINRANKKKHMVTHKDILIASILCIEFDKNAKKINMID